MDIQGTSSIVTGGGSGLGAATARKLAEKGARVVILDMQDDKGEAMAKEVEGVFVHADVTNTDEVIAAVEAAKELGPLRSLVTAAGIGWATRTIGRDGAYDSAHDLDDVQEGHRDQPGRHVQLHPSRRHRHEPDRAARRQRARRDRHRRLGRGVRRPDRPGQLLRRRRVASSA